jgi:hypothetical protein
MCQKPFFTFLDFARGKEKWESGLPVKKASARKEVGYIAVVLFLYSLNLRKARVCGRLGWL